MRVVIFGATGMVGQGVLRECVLADDVSEVVVVGRTSTGRKHRKLVELITPDLFDLSSVIVQLTDLDACFFCLGVSSVGMDPETYRRTTYDLTLSVAEELVAKNPDLVFVYVSGTGTDTSEHGRVRWARVKGATENALLRMPFRAYAFRPGIIQPKFSVQSKTRLPENRFVEMVDIDRLSS
jgi:uncharacterized protein YbjT (DUF2867 family)